MLKILGLNYRFTHPIRPEMDNAWGRMRCDQPTIEIAADIHGDQEKSTLIHEIIEAGNQMLDIGLEERQIKCLEVVMFQALTENGVDLSPLIGLADG